MVRLIAASGMLALALAACAGEEHAPEEDAAPPTIVLDGERLFPESLASDAASNLYIGSNPGLIFRAAAGSDSAPVWITPSEANGLMNVFGVLADDDRGLLWVCTNPAMGAEGAPAIKAFDLADGSLKASYSLGVEGPAMCNDMTIAANGDVYASEMIGGRILRLASGAEGFAEWASDPEFASIDGIAFAADGTLYANSIQRGTFLRVGLDADGAFGGVEVLETSRPLQQPDGLRALADGRMLQSEGAGGVVTVLTIPAEGVVQVTNIASGIDYASSVTEVDGRVFYPEGKLSYLFDPNMQMQDPGDFSVFNAEIPAAE